jgi:hypothetical protein
MAADRKRAVIAPRTLKGTQGWTGEVFLEAFRLRSCGVGVLPMTFGRCRHWVFLQPSSATVARVSIEIDATGK